MYLNENGDKWRSVGLSKIKTYQKSVTLYTKFIYIYIYIRKAFKNFETNEFCFDINISHN